MSARVADFELERRLSLVAPQFRADARRMPENVAIAWLFAHLLVAAAVRGEVPLAAIAEQLRIPDPLIMSADRAAHVVGAIVASVMRQHGWKPTRGTYPTGKAWPRSGARFVRMTTLEPLAA